MAGKERGFSLLEVLLSVMIIGLLTGLSLPLFNSFLARNDLDISAQHLAETLRRAQVYSRAMKHDSAWSVRVEPTVVTLFRGTDFSGRDTAHDETVLLPGTVTASGLGEVQFAKLSSVPNAAGAVTLTSNANETRTVTVNAQGMVDY